MKVKVFPLWKLGESMRHVHPMFGNSGFEAGVEGMKCSRESEHDEFLAGVFGG